MFSITGNTETHSCRIATAFRVVASVASTSWELGAPLGERFILMRTLKLKNLMKQLVSEYGKESVSRDGDSITVEYPSGGATVYWIENQQVLSTWSH